MPPLARRFLIWAAVDGLILQAHGPADHQKTVQINYNSKKGQIKELQNIEATRARGNALESHGIIGLLSIASTSFLIAITQREQVAQIFGKPVFVITDIALLPLSSQSEADTAITAANTGSAARTSNEESGSVVEDSESELSDAEGDDDDGSLSSDTEPQTPVDKKQGTLHRSSSATSIARDVWNSRVQYGRFASQWFSRRGWGAAGKNPSSTSNTDKDDTATEPTTSEGGAVADAAAAANRLEPKDDGMPEDEQAEQVMTDGSIKDALPKILRTTKMILTSGGFFFSYDFDLTRRLAVTKGATKAPSPESLDPLYFWNRRLATPFLDSRQDSLLMPILQGFVGQRSFVVAKKSQSSNDQEAEVVAAQVFKETETTGGLGLENAVNRAKQTLTSITGEETQEYLLTLISRRSVKRSGLRYLRRGIDDEGNCANAVETEQILSAPDWSPTRKIRSFVQIRASIPLYFSQSPYALKPAVVIHQSESKNETALKKHFQDLKRRYGGVQVVALVDKHGTEAKIGEAFEKTVRALQESHQLDDHVQFEWFDFHAECRGMKFENVSRLVDKIEHTINKYGETIISTPAPTGTGGGVEVIQSGIIRTNCMDCLDRTNVAQSAFGQYMLQKDLGAEGFEIDLLHDETTTWFNTLWADNGDAISRQYASTAALKGDFTRTRRRNYRGALNDFSLTLTRYYNNMVNDYFSQAVIDVLLGNISWRVFEDFESTMKSADPGISIDQVRETAIENCAKQVIQDPDEDLIHGWTMLTPAQDNTLRTLPFEEAVVLLTDAAIYCCRFDWATEKLASFEKIDLRSVSKIRYGTYITSTLSERQMKENLNVGVVVVYQPSKGTRTIRTNTRSLQNYVTPSGDAANRIDGGTGILSWLSSNSPPSSRTLALKVIPSITSITQPDGREARGRTESQPPLAVAETIADEIRRAIVGGSKEQQQNDTGDLVEKQDIISLQEAKKRTGYLEQLGYSIKKMVWT
ncbi:Phosphatidylinositide phosphatase SAC2 [Exophiala dermatitidis]